ncbi:hypothetical protein ACT7DE_00015 [Bacillus paranthracis]
MEKAIQARKKKNKKKEKEKLSTRDIEDLMRIRGRDVMNVDAEL